MACFFPEGLFFTMSCDHQDASPEGRKDGGHLARTQACTIYVRDTPNQVSATRLASAGLRRVLAPSDFHLSASITIFTARLQFCLSISKASCSDSSIRCPSNFFLVRTSGHRIFHGYSGIFTFHDMV